MLVTELESFIIGHIVVPWTDFPMEYNAVNDGKRELIARKYFVICS